MRPMLLLKGDEHTEAGELVIEARLTAMGRHKRELIDARVLRAGDWIQPISKGARVPFSGDEMTPELRQQGERMRRHSAARS